MSNRSFALETVETSITTGTGTYNLGGIPAGSAYRTFRQEFANGETKIAYMVRNAANTKWELNYATTLTFGTPDTLTRAVVRSTNGDAAVSWVAGDLPLTIYSCPNQDVQDGFITGWLAAARHALILLGFWWKKDTPSAGFHQWNAYDGASDVASGIVNTVAHDLTIYGTPRGYIDGLTMSRNAGTPTTKLDIAAGEAMDSTGVVCIRIGGGLTKRTGGAWAAGNDVNGMGNGLTIANSTWYHVFTILNAGLRDIYFDTSISAANKPTGTTHFRRIGSFKTNGSAQIIDFLQFVDRFYWMAEVADANGVNFGGFGGSVTTTVTTPPGLNAVWLGVIQGYTSGPTGGWNLSLATPGVAGSLIVCGFSAGGAGDNGQSSSYAEVVTSTTPQITSVAPSVGGAYNIFITLITRGWIDSRGRG